MTKACKKVGAIVFGVMLIACSGDGGTRNDMGACTATFSGPDSATATCQVTAVFAVTANTTSVAFTGMPSGAQLSWDGISFDLDGKPTNGSFDLATLTDVSGRFSDGANNEWVLTGGAGTSPTLGQLEVAIHEVSVGASEPSGTLYTLHGTATAHLASDGSGSLADELVTLSY